MKVGSQNYLALFERKLNSFVTLEADDRHVLEELIQVRQKFAANTELIHEGRHQDTCYFMLEGWGFCYKVLKDGTRQIIHFPIAGDLIGVRSQLLRTVDHSFATISQSVMAPISTRRFMEITDTMPRLGRAFVWAIARDGAIITQHLVNLGRRNAIERMAHFLLEIRERLRFIGIEVNGEFKCPLSQEHLADALGLTPVHVNRVLRRLRVMNLVSLSHGELHIHNVQGLEALASYDDAYLDQDE